nr:substrate-binding domain-containing protein [Luteolibacter marinus]
MIWASRDASWVEALLDRGIPLVSVSGDWPVERVPCISFDSEAVVKIAVEHLAATAPARLLYVDFRTHGLPVKERRCQMFVEHTRRLGIPATCHQVFEPADAADSEAARRLPLGDLPARRLRQALASSPLPVGIWCGEDHLARRVCDLATDMGLRVPEDIAVLGLGDFPVAECGHPTLSSIPLPGERIGFEALAVLHRHLIEGKRPPPFTPVPPPPVTRRESTAGHSPDDPLGRAMSLIASGACEGITVKEVAAGVGMSPQSLHARFNRQFGQPPGEAIRGARLAAAKRHLADPSLTVSRVAALCGFDQVNRFSSFFRRETGSSPRDWRKDPV